MVVPAEIPLTIPAPDHMVATPVALLVHTPPDVASVNVVVSPTQTFGVPPIAAGTALVVNTTVAVQPPGNV